MRANYFCRQRFWLIIGFCSVCNSNGPPNIMTDVYNRHLLNLKLPTEYHNGNLNCFSRPVQGHAGIIQKIRPRTRRLTSFPLLSSLSIMLFDSSMLCAIDSGVK
jgi:hypothetical protein